MTGGRAFRLGLVVAAIASALLRGFADVLLTSRTGSAGRRATGRRSPRTS